MKLFCMKSGFAFVQRKKNREAGREPKADLASSPLVLFDGSFSPCECEPEQKRADWG